MIHTLLEEHVFTRLRWVYPPQAGPIAISMSHDEHMIRDPSKPETRTHCIRCGECCLRSSPTLQAEDLHLVEKGFLKKRDLVTFRKGEFVNDPVQEVIGPAVNDYVKIKEKAEIGCIFYDGAAKACTIYHDRPLQCRALTCWDTREIMDVLGRPKLRRQDVVHHEVLLGLMEEHEKRCSYAAIEDHVHRISREGNKAVERLLGLLKFDYHLRPFVSDKLHIPLDEMDFYFGRPLVDTIRSYGLQVLREPDGSFFLTKIRKNGVLE